jgi:hypothetical protein
VDENERDLMWEVRELMSKKGVSRRHTVVIQGKGV